MEQDREYVARRESFISAAERYANEKHGEAPRVSMEREEWVSLWNTTFHKSMDFMSRSAATSPQEAEALLRKANL